MGRTGGIDSIQKKIKQRVLNFSTWREGKERA